MKKSLLILGIIIIVGGTFLFFASDGADHGLEFQNTDEVYLEPFACGSFAGEFCSTTLEIDGREMDCFLGTDEDGMTILYQTKESLLTHCREVTSFAEPKESLIEEIEKTSDTRLLEVTLEIDAPFSSATISIDHNGLVRYVAKARYQEEVRDEAMFSSEQMQLLLTTIENNGFFNMETESTDEGPVIADDTAYTLSVKTVIDGPESIYADASVHEVTCLQYSTCTQGFDNIKEKIIEFWGKEVLEVGV